MKNFQDKFYINDYDLKDLEEIPFEPIDENDEDENYDSFKRGRFTIMVKKESSNSHLSIKGKNIVFTGRGPYTRGVLMKMAREYGAFAISNSISKHTEVLVVGEKPGSKFATAKRNNIKIMSMEEFLNQINDI